MMDTALPVRIVLSHTSHPGNVGAVARAMKNMGLSELHLVNPCEYRDYEAYARASGADDVLNAAVVHPQLHSAISDCGLVFGTSARQRHIPFVPVEPRDCAAQAVQVAKAGNRVAVVFGSERTGLQNEELALCHHLVTIPTSDVYTSLNLAMAVQIIAYEIFLAARGECAAPERDEPLATIDDLERMYVHLSDVLEGTHFRDHSQSGNLMSRVRRIFNRAQLDQRELRILRGMLTALQDKQQA
ncbi:MAG TPA: RNA methyltransferase [Steroidobacteraceae bacterium]|nr:RNA methyltransferase [Steroidobacteraceae bacterium]